MQWIAGRLVRAVRTGSLSTLPGIQAVQRRHFVGAAVAMLALDAARVELGEEPVYNTVPRPPSAGNGAPTAARLDHRGGVASAPVTS